MIPTREAWHAALVARHGDALQHKIEKTTVAICGLGGLGSNVAIMLARAGIGRLLLMDFDKVDVANLNRQQYKANQTGMPKAAALQQNLEEIAPYVETEALEVKITEENGVALLKEADIICESFDVPENKAMLTNLVLEKLPEKYLVAASGMAGLGDANLIKTRKLSDHFYLCGDGVSDVKDGMGLFSSRVTACAAHEAHAIVRIITEEL